MNQYGQRVPISEIIGYVDLDSERKTAYLRGKRRTMHFDEADRRTSLSGNNMLWHENPVLQEIYWEGDVPPDYSKPVRCVKCGDWFAVNFGNDGDTPTSICSKHAQKPRRHDGDEFCIHGHDLSILGLYNGRCVACRKENRRRHINPRKKPRTFKPKNKRHYKLVSEMTPAQLERNRERKRLQKRNERARTKASKI